MVLLVDMLLLLFGIFGCMFGVYVVFCVLLLVVLTCV